MSPIQLAVPGRRLIYTDDHEAFRDSVSRFLAAEVTPHLEQWSASGEIPREVFTAAGAAGFLGAAVPEEFGGGGTDDMGFLAVLIDETVAGGATALAMLWALQAGVVIPALRTAGHTRLLAGLAAGELIATVAPADAAELTLADGRMSGELRGVFGARLADLILIDLDDAGVAVVEIDQPGVLVGPASPTLAVRDAAAATVTLTGAPIEVVQAPLTGRLDLWFAAIALASARAALALGVEYVGARKVFGRPLAEFENTRFRLAELSAGLAGATAFTDSCVADCMADATRSAADAAAARLSAMRLLDEVVDQCLQLHGGYGYMREYPISSAFADARFLRLAAQRFSDPRTVLAVRLGL